MIQIGNSKIGLNYPCFIIAEAGVNHDGKLEKAKLLVDIAKEAGVDAVKFQTWKTENLILKDTAKAEYQREQTGEGSQYEMIKTLELSYDQFRELKEYCEKKRILFLSTPDEEESAEFLFQLGVPAIKVGSGELTNLLYLKRLARYHKLLILSTGMAVMGEVIKAKETIFEERNTELILLHCTTDYPTSLSEVNLLAMETLGKETGCLVGYSDHTIGTDVPLIALSLGAVVIEKHFTYDKSAKGPDHSASLSPSELKELVQKIRRYEKLSSVNKEKQIQQIPNLALILGSKEKRPSLRESKNKIVVRKSLVAKEFIPAGTIIIEDLLAMKRTGGKGIPAENYQKILGKRLKVALKKDTILEDYYF